MEHLLEASMEISTVLAQGLQQCTKHIQISVIGEFTFWEAQPA